MALFIRDRLPITKGDPSRIPPPPAVLGPVFSFSQRKLCAVRQPASQRLDPFPPRHRTRLLSLYKRSSFPCRWLQSITKTALWGGGSFVPWLRRLIHESHTLFSFHAMFLSLSLYLLFLSPSLCSLCLLFQGINRRRMLSARLKIKNRLALKGVHLWSAANPEVVPRIQWNLQNGARPCRRGWVIRCWLTFFSRRVVPAKSCLFVRRGDVISCPFCRAFPSNSVLSFDRRSGISSVWKFKWRL